MSDENDYFSTSEIKLLLRVRLSMENEFTSGRRKKSVLWAKVVDEVKKVNKDLKIDRNIAQRKRPVLAVNQTGVKAAFKYFIKHLIKNTDATGYQKLTSKVDQFIRK